MEQVMDMETKQYEISKYMQAISCLPPRLMREAMQIPMELTEEAEEIRLRCGYPLSIVCMGRETSSSGAAVEASELNELLARASRYSVHSYREDLSRGFLPLEGGHRLGLCGTIARNGGEIVGYRTLSSVCIRIAREIKGVSDGVYSKVLLDRRCKNTLIIAPPGVGKTTMLRDLIRRISLDGIKVGVADERSELAALCGGKPQFDLGPCVDVIDGMHKADAAMRLIRTMSPDVIAMDEITEEQDLRTIQMAAHCGVSILATAHGIDGKDLLRKKLFRDLFKQCMFDRILVMNYVDGKRSLKVEEMEC